MQQALADAEAELRRAQQVLVGRLRGVWDRLVNDVLAAVPIEPLTAELRQQVKELGLQDPRGLRVHAALGPLHVEAFLPSVQVETPSLERPITLGPQPPSGFAASLDAGPIKGAGSLVNGLASSAGVGGAVAGGAEPEGRGGREPDGQPRRRAEVAALASLRHAPDGWPSFLAVLSAGFTPGIQLGFGFQINRVGGIVGIERRLDPRRNRRTSSATAARRRCCSRSTSARAARAALAARRPAVPAGRRQRRGRADLPPGLAGGRREGLRLGRRSPSWSSCPGPAGSRWSACCSAGITDPVRLVRLRADFAGVLDFARRAGHRRRGAGRQRRARHLHGLRRPGLRHLLGDPPYTVLSLGGFYPGFRPEPAQIRPLQRLGMSPRTCRCPGCACAPRATWPRPPTRCSSAGGSTIGIDAGIASVTASSASTRMIQFTPVPPPRADRRRPRRAVPRPDVRRRPLRRHDRRTRAGDAARQDHGRDLLQGLRLGGHLHLRRAAATAPGRAAQAGAQVLATRSGAPRTSRRRRPGIADRRARGTRTGAGLRGRRLRAACASGPSVGCRCRHRWTGSTGARWARSQRVLGHGSAPPRSTPATGSRPARSSP